MMVCELRLVGLSTPQASCKPETSRHLAGCPGTHGDLLDYKLWQCSVEHEFHISMDDKIYVLCFRYTKKQKNQLYKQSCCHFSVERMLIHSPRIATEGLTTPPYERGMYNPAQVRTMTVLQRSSRH